MRVVVVPVGLEWASGVHSCLVQEPGRVSMGMGNVIHIWSENVDIA